MFAWNPLSCTAISHHCIQRAFISKHVSVDIYLKQQISDLVPRARQ